MTPHPEPHEYEAGGEPFGPDDDPGHDTQSGVAVGWAFIALMVSAIALVVALYQWRVL